MESPVQTSKSSYIPCEVSDGSFEGEYAIKINQPKGDAVTLFADESLVIENAGKRYLRVTRVSTEGDIGIFLLPTEAIENGSRWVRMPQEQALDR